MSRLAIVGILALVACATTPPPPQPPDWVALSGKTEADDTPNCSRSLFGVGGVSNIRNPSLRHASAVNAARADLSQRLSVCLMKDLENRFAQASEVLSDKARASYLEFLNAALDLAVNFAEVTKEWKPNEDSEYLYIELPPKFVALPPE